MFWPFISKKSIISSGYMQGMVDWHSHILPGVDDGIKRLETSLRVLSFYEENGVREVWLTPHIMEDCPNTTDGLRTRFEELLDAYAGNIKLHLASENMMDGLLIDRLEHDDVLPIGYNHDHLLMETSYFNAPAEFNTIINLAKKKGFHPVLAHPERYRYMDEEEYDRLHGEGVVFQLNFLSLMGGYGDTARKTAMMLLKKGYYRVSGSDLHRLKAFRKMADHKSSAISKCLKYLPKDSL